MNNDKWTVDGGSEETDDVFEHDEDIERFLENPDAIIAFCGIRYIFKVESGCITDDAITDVEEIIRHTAIDYEYPLHGMNVMNDWIEVKVDISVEEPALKGAEVFQNRLKRAGITTELAYVGTFGRQ